MCMACALHVCTQVSTLGRMDVVWKTSMGEAGRLQSNTVQRKLPAARGVEIHLVSAPSEVALAAPFEITCSVCMRTHACMLT